MTASLNTAPQITAPEPGLGKAFRGLWLLTWKARFSLRRIPALLAMLLVVPALAFSTLKEGTPEPYYHWTLTFYFLLLLPLYCLSTCGAMIRDEIQADTLRFLITRPVTRLQLFLGKYLCQMIVLQSLALVSGLLFISVGLARRVPDLGKFAFLFLGAQFLAVMAYGALSALLGLIARRYLILGVLYGFVIELGIGGIPTNINNLSMARHLRTVLANNFEVRSMYDWSRDGTFASIIMLFVGTGIFLAAGAALFTFREFHAHEEMQK